MKPEEQRIAIALLMGAKWAFMESGYTWLTMRESAPGFLPVDAPADPSKVVISDSIPDYLGSLDAMHEAEKVLDGETIANEPPHLTQYDRYLIALDDITPDSVRATAPQRAEALLRALDLWKP